MQIGERMPKVYVTIDMPDGVICKGSGHTIDEAYKDALANFELTKVPKHGPWKWELRDNNDK